MENNSLDMIELLRILYVSRKLIAIIVIVVALAAVVYSLLTPQIFSSQASFYAVGDNISQLPFDIPGLSGITSSLLGSESSQKAENFIEVMESRVFAEDIIRKHRLIDYFKLDHPDSLRNMDDALKAFSKKIVSFDYSETTGLLRVKVSTKSKQLSLNIVNDYLTKLDEYNRHQKVTQSKLNRQFLEKRVHETKATLDSLIMVNRKFQEGTKAIHLESQAKALIDSYGAVIADKMKLEIELELAKANYGIGSPFTKNLELRKEGLEKQIIDLERSGNTPEYLISIGKIPEVASQYARIQMDMEIYKTLFTYLYPQYEAARLSELRDMPSIELLDTPRLAGRRDHPRRAIICIFSTLAAFVLAVAVAMLREVWNRNQIRLRKIVSLPQDGRQ
jgi:uncharacterized protein involved in exopolysaccharide biosynthesis